jgi:hypothetical protein
MKLHSIIAPLSENDDDMFPGVASSVFDEVPDDQSEKDTNDIDWMNNQIDKFMSVEQVYKRKREKLLDDMEKNGAKVYIGTAGTGRNAGPNIIPYSSFDWFDSDMLQLAGLSNFHGIEKSSPYLKDIENTIRLVRKYYKREVVFRKKKSAMFTTKMDMNKGR